MENNKKEIAIYKKIETYTGLLEDNINSCNAVMMMKTIMAIDYASSPGKLEFEGIDTITALKTSRKIDKKVREFIDKFDNKCVSMPRS